MSEKKDEVLDHRLEALGGSLESGDATKTVTEEELASLNAAVATRAPPDVEEVVEALHRLDSRQAADELKEGDRVVDLSRIERQVEGSIPGMIREDAQIDGHLERLGEAVAKEGAELGINHTLLLVAQSLNSRQKRTLSQINTQLWTVRPFRWIGWLFLALSAMDFGGLLIDLDLMNPQSELELIQGFIDRIPIPLLGVALVFWGGAFRRTALELLALKGLTWVCLGLGIFLIGLGPLALVDGKRLDTERTQKLLAAQQQMAKNAGQVDARLGAVGSPAELEALLQQVTGKQVQLPADAPLDQLLASTQQRITEARSARKGKIEQALTTGRAKFWMGTLKWAMGAILSGIIFVLVWRMMRWVRLTNEPVFVFDRWRRKRKPPAPAKP